MTKTSLFAAMFVIGASGLAHAGGEADSIGVGAEFQINGLGGASLNFDTGAFHVGGFLGFYDPEGRENSVFGVGARFYYHVHSTAMADFGVGGSFGVVSLPPENPADPNDDRRTAVYVEPGVQMRVFLASNVALSASTGIVIGVIDAGGVGITGQGVAGSLVDLGGGVGFAGGAGLHYYFF